MIRVEPANEPESFDEIVRKPGHRAIAELVGEEGLPARRGRPRGGSGANTRRYSG